MKQINTSRHYIHGVNLYATQPAQARCDPIVTFKEKATGRSLYLNDEILSSHLLLLGETGSGKTNVLKHIVYSLIQYLEAGDHDDDVVFVFDPKEELCDYFYDPANPRHRILSSGKNRKHSMFWNIYEEIFPKIPPCKRATPVQIGTQDEFELALDVCDHLFTGTEASHNPFFPSASKTLLAAKLVYDYRRAVEEKSVSQLSNAELSRFFRSEISPSAYNVIAQTYADLRYIRSLFGYATSNELGEMGSGVFALLTEHINRTIHGDFAADRVPNRVFGGRTAAAKKGAMVYFLCFDPSDISSKAIFSLIIDSIIKVQLSQNLANRGHTYLILEEARLLLPLKNLEQGLNEGRSLGLRCIASLQSVSQLYSGYGNPQEAESILGGFTNAITLRSTNKATREMLSDRAGKCYVDYAYSVDDPEFPTRESVYFQRDGQVIEDWDILSLDKGQSIVLLNNHPPFRMDFPEYNYPKRDES